MNRKAFKTCMATLATGLGLLGGAPTAVAQTPPGQTPTTTTVAFPGDWPNLGAYSNRQGRNANPYAFTSGQTVLRYLTPNTIQDRAPIILYATDQQANEISNQPTSPQTPVAQVYDNPQYSAFDTNGKVLSYVFPSTPAVATLPDWLPATVDADLAYDVAPTPLRRIRDINVSATYPYDAAPRAFQYEYATCVPAARNSSNPAQTQSGAAPKVFTWRFQPQAGGLRTYALYANVPVGPTNIPIDATQPTSAKAFRYTQDYFVYEIRWGADADGDGLPDNHITDVRYVGGASTVRLGISGQEDGTVFPSNGTPIVVRLFNTVPRYSQLPAGASDDKTDRLVLQGSQVGDTDATESASALLHLVYADATTVRPEVGTYSASPAAATLAGNAAQTTPPFFADEAAATDWDVTVARNDLVTGFNSTGTYFVANQGVVTNYEANIGSFVQDPVTGVVTHDTARPGNTTFPFNLTTLLPQEKWHYSTLENASATTVADNPDTAPPGSSFVVGTANPFFTGTNYLTAPASANTTVGTDSISYAPTLAAGDYAIYAYLPGNKNGERYGHRVLYQISEGTVVTSVYVDQSTTQGWTRIGTRRFTSSGSDTTPDLTVNVFSQSILDPTTNPVTPEAAGTRVYADAIRFVSNGNGGVTSTPVHATVAITPQGGGTPVPTKVVIVADEAGKIHCLDENGRGDGTTREYWSYPSTPDLGDDTWVDPNLFGGSSSVDPDHDPASSDTTTPTAPGPDGAYNKSRKPFRSNVPTALMPSGFNLSTATIAHVAVPGAPASDPGRDLLYIGATNGRVYCLDTSGRGDYDLRVLGNTSTQTRKVGTVRRQWSFPNDYPQAVQASALGAFRGSIVFGDVNQGAVASGSTAGVVYLPAQQGRVYALDAYGTPITDGSVSGTTATAATGGVATVEWRFPEIGHTPLPAIRMTPTLLLPTGGGDGRLFFGTQINANDESSGQFYCLNARTGDAVWDINGEAYNAGVSDVHILSNTVRQTDASLSTVTRITTSTDAGGTVTVGPVTAVQAFGDFNTGPVAVDATTLGQVPASVATTAPVSPNFSTDTTPTTVRDTLYVLNDNGILYGLDASNGNLILGHDGVHTLRTAANTLSEGNLAYTVTRVFNRNEGSEYIPEIAVPGTNATVTRIFARVDDYTNGDSVPTTGTAAADQTYLGNYYEGGNELHNATNNPLAVPIGAVGVAAADNYLFATDAEGGFYAFGDVPSTDYIPVPGFDTGVSNIISVNNPLGRAFRHLHIKLVTRAAYLKLKQVNADGTGGLTFAQFNDPSIQKPRVGSNPYAFEWGETAYVAVYGFPYATYAPTNPVSRIAPPTINVTLNSDNGATRTFPVDSRQFNNPTQADKIQDKDPTTGGDLLDPNGTAYLQDGYAVVPIAFSNAGNTSLPPGGGTISAALSTGALSTSGASQTVPADTRTGYGNPAVNDATVRFVLANPLAIAIADPSTGKASSDSLLQIGYSPIENATSTGLLENIVNGTPNIATDVAPAYRSQLTAPAGNGNHGTTSTTRVYVYDRSLMTLLQEDGIGNVRMARTNLQRQGGLATDSAIVQPLDSNRYPGFEDKPIYFPNTSLDFPNIGREQIRASATADGATGNPILSNVRLAVPTIDGKTPLNVNSLDANNDRYPMGTPVDISIDVPLYQPPVATGKMSVLNAGPDDPNDLTYLRHNSRGDVVGYQGNLVPAAQGYVARVQVFIDSNNNGQLTTNATGRKPYRGFNLIAGVNPQYSILTNSPNVDLGSLAAGTGLEIGKAPYGKPYSGGQFDPWGAALPGSWGGVYQPISVRNDGNVSLLNLRVAKGTNDNGNANQTTPWSLTTVDNDPLSFLAAQIYGNGSGSLWSNIDATFAVTNTKDTVAENRVILPKPRVTDRTPTELVADPYPRANPNLRLDATGHVVSTPPGSVQVGRVVDGSKVYALNVNNPYAPSQPKVGVSVPLGFPVGNYSTQIRVVEDGSIGNDLGEVLQYANGVYEAYSDPITLTWKVRETRMTNRSTPRTSPVIDNASLFTGAVPTTGPDRGNPATFRNAAPAAMRTVDGSLLVAWESDRDKAVPGGVGTGISRIFLSGAKSDAKFGANGNANPSSYNPPLWDLTQFETTGSTWFQTNADAFPGASDVSAAFPSAVLGTTRFGSPAFAARSGANWLDFATGNTAPSLMAFVGEAQVSTGTARIAESKVFLTSVSMNDSGVPTATGLLATASDPQTTKGKPSVLPLTGTGGAFVFYSETSAGQSGITADRLSTDGKSFAPPIPLDFGGGFSSVFSPSATARFQYRNTNNPIVEMSFAGKLRGRSNAEAYLGRLRLGTPVASDPNDASYRPTDTALQLLDAQGRTAEYAKAGTPFMLLPVQTSERLLGEGGGAFRARGVAWDRAAFLTAVRAASTSTNVLSPLVQVTASASGMPVGIDLLVPGTALVDRQSGLIVADSRLGGKVYIDPDLGTVRFVGAAINPNAEIRLTYDPTFLRVNPGGSTAYSSINGLYDDRYAQAMNGNRQTVAPAYWFSGTGKYSGTGNFTGQVRSDRFLYAYSRGASSGVTARPYLTTLRFGLRLPTRIATDQDGNVVGITVTGNQYPYQVDPANGRVYFQAEDEGQNVSVIYTGVNEATGAPVSGIPVSGAVSFVLERGETPIAIDEAANESSLTAFLDPFTFNSNANQPRPPLVWLFYVSTRAGQPDLYFQTIAPNFTPAPK